MDGGAEGVRKGILVRQHDGKQQRKNCEKTEGKIEADKNEGAGQQLDFASVFYTIRNEK